MSDQSLSESARRILRVPRSLLPLQIAVAPAQWQSARRAIALEMPDNHLSIKRYTSGAVERLLTLTNSASPDDSELGSLAGAGILYVDVAN